MSNFLKTFVSQKIFAIIGLRKIYFKIPKILDLENVICIITKNLVNVAMCSDAWFYNIFMYLYNKNILKYAQILVTSGRFMIFHIEGYSTKSDDSLLRSGKS